MANTTVNWSSVKSKLRGKTLSFATETEAVKALVDAGVSQDEAKACVRDSSLVPDGTIKVTSFVVSAGTGRGGVMTATFINAEGNEETKDFSLSKIRYEQALKLKKEFWENYGSIAVNVSKEAEGASIVYGSQKGQEGEGKFNIVFSSSAEMLSARRLTPIDLTFPEKMARMGQESLLGVYQDSFKTKDVKTIQETGETVIKLYEQLKGVKKGLPVL